MKVTKAAYELIKTIAQELVKSGKLVVDKHGNIDAPDETKDVVALILREHGEQFITHLHFSEPRLGATLWSERFKLET